MIGFSGYHNLYLISRGPTFNLIRGQRVVDQKKVIIKQANHQLADKQLEKFLKEENNRLQKWTNNKWIVKSEHKTYKDSNWLEYTNLIDFKPLSLILSNHNIFYLDPYASIEFFIQLLRAIESVHQKNHLHGHINPNDIWINEEGDVLISGFGVSAPLNSLDAKKYTRYNDLDERNHYISPEQTGRTKARIDLRSDIYSLGLIFYECLTRSRAFNFRENSAIINAQITQYPQQISILNSEVPTNLIRIIEKMIKKDTRERYQSLEAVEKDLIQVFHSPVEIDKAEESRTINIPEGDFFRIPSLLFGRETEISAIKEIINNSKRFNRNQIIFFSGVTGSGKSYLGEEIFRQLDESSFFLLNSSIRKQEFPIPYQVISNIIQQLIHRILLSSADTVSTWVSLFKSYLGEHTSLIVNAIPEFALLLGKQVYDGMELSDETEVKLDRSYSLLLKSIAHGPSPVIMFMDEWHLSDTKSRSLIKHWIQTCPEGNIIMMLSINPENIDAKDLSQYMWGSNKTNLSHLEISGLSNKKVAEFVNHIFSLALDQNSEEINTIQKKTGGLPLFIRDFLERAFQSKAIVFNEINHEWVIDARKLAALPVLDSLSGLLSRHLKLLPEKTAKLIEIPSAIGMEFESIVIAKIKKSNAKIISNELTPAVNLGLISQIEVQNFDKEVQKSIDTYPRKFSFAHEKVRQEIYQKINIAERSKLHFEIYKALENLNQSVPLFEKTYHVYRGYEHLAELEKKQAKSLLIEAGLKSKLAASYALSHQYLEKALSLVTSQDWLDSPKEYHELLLSLIETSFLIGQNEKGMDYFQLALDRSQFDVDKAKVYLSMTLIHTHLSQGEKSYYYAQQGLALFNMEVPEDVGKGATLLEIIKTRIALIGFKEEKLLSLPDFKEEKQQLIEMLYFRSLTYAITKGPELYTVIGLKLFRNVLKNGIGIYSFSGFSLYSAIVAQAFGKFDASIQYLNICLNIARRVNRHVALGGAQFGLGMGGIYKLPMEKCLEHFEIAFKEYDLSGSLFYSSTSTNHLALYYFILGYDLKTCIQKTNYYITYSKHANSLDTIDFLSSTKLVLELLQNPAKKLENHQQYPDAFNNMTPIHACWHHILMAFYFFLVNNIDRAYEEIQKSRDLIHTTVFHVMYMHFFAIESLVVSRYFQYKGLDLPKKEYKQLKKGNKLLKKYAKHNPINFDHLYHLSTGGLNFSNKNYAQAIHYFEKGLATINSGKYPKIKAILELSVCEASRLEGNESNARDFAFRAIEGFKKWGANTVVTAQRQVLGELLNVKDDVELHVKRNIDISAVIKASQLISSQIDINEILKNLTRLAMENTGAHRGILMLNSKEGIKVNLLCEQNEIESIELVDVHLENAYDIVPLPLIRYVERTSKTMLVEDTEHLSDYFPETYCGIHKPQSAICKVISNKNKLIGILYLENKLIKGAFRSEHLEVLTILNAQAGISIENARMFSETIELNKAYERFVPNEFLNFLGKESILDVELGNQVQKEMTVLFSDIRNFTNISESMNPQENFNFINTFLGEMEPIVSAHNGFIDKFIGDAIMALFPGKPDDAVKCAIQMQLQLKNIQFENNIEIEMGIGINTGLLMLGTIGGSQRMEGTVISDDVNLASRIESMTKTFEKKILITEQTKSKLTNPGDFNIHLIDHVIVKGKSKKIGVFEVLIH